MLSLIKYRILSIINSRELSRKIKQVEYELEPKNNLYLAYLIEGNVKMLEMWIKSVSEECLHLIREQRTDPYAEIKIKKFTTSQMALDVLSNLIKSDRSTSNDIKLPSIDLDTLQRVWLEAFKQLQHFQTSHQIPEKTPEIVAIELIAEKLISSPTESLMNELEDEGRLIKEIKRLLNKQELNPQKQLNNIFNYFFIAKQDERVTPPLFQEIKKNLQEIAFFFYNSSPLSKGIDEKWIEKKFKPISFTFSYPKSTIDLHLIADTDLPFVNEKQFNREFLSNLGLHAFCGFPPFPLDENSSTTTPIKNQQPLNTLGMFMNGLEKIGVPLRVSQALAQLLLQTGHKDSHIQIHTVALYNILKVFNAALFGTEASQASLIYDNFLFQPIHTSRKTKHSIDVTIPCYTEISSLERTNQGRVGYPKLPAIASINFGAVITFDSHNAQQLEISCFANVLLHTEQYPSLRSELETASKSRQTPPDCVKLNIIQHFSPRPATNQVSTSDSDSLTDSPITPSKQLEISPQQETMTMYKTASVSSLYRETPSHGSENSPAAGTVTSPVPLRQEQQPKSPPYTPSTIDSLTGLAERLGMRTPVQTPRSEALPPTPQSDAGLRRPPLNLARPSPYGDEESGPNPFGLRESFRPIPFSLSRQMTPPSLGGAAAAEGTPKPSVAIRSPFYTTALAVKKHAEDDFMTAEAADFMTAEAAPKPPL
ncbi:MAG: hypothetical protein K0S08_195 [Gammaproteobacteria bacterium]|jgi:hypothetical protein|nr:hypothetical protein [Gammaproteobacteria bacterium]